MILSFFYELKMINLLHHENIHETCDSKDSYFSQENAVPLEIVMKRVVITVVVMKAHHNQPYEKHNTGLMHFRSV